MPLCSFSSPPLRTRIVSCLSVRSLCVLFQVVFTTKLCHPNVHFKSGEICLDVLKDAWTPIWTLESTCRAIIALLGAPDASSPLNCDAGNLIRAGDMIGFQSLARMYTLDYGSKEIPQINTVVKTGL